MPVPDSLHPSKKDPVTHWCLPPQNTEGSVPPSFVTRIDASVARGDSKNYSSGDYEIVCWEGGEESLSERPVYVSRPHAITFDDVSACSARHEVAAVPGAFMISNVLTADECSQLIALSEAMGYTDWMGLETCIWMADPTIQDRIFERCKDHLPEEIGGGGVCGLHSRWRIYRYNREDTFGPHLDGSYGASIVRDGQIVEDAYPDRWSQLTFLLYLNEDFEGGETSFIIPPPPAPTDTNINRTDDSSRLKSKCKVKDDIVRVRPSQGSVLCFYQQGSPHNIHADASPLHEGSTVSRGMKYAVRSDVMYYLPTN